MRSGYRPIRTAVRARDRGGYIQTAEDELPDPMARLRPPRVTEKPVPFFISIEYSKLEKACRGSTFAQRRDAANLAVFKASGIRLSEMPRIRYYPDDPDRSDLDLDSRQIRIRGKGGKERTVKIDKEAARRVGRYLRVRPRAGRISGQAHYRPEYQCGPPGPAL